MQRKLFHYRRKSKITVRRLDIQLKNHIHVKSVNIPDNSGVAIRYIERSETATEIKSAYGRVSATAKKKCLQIYEYGICKSNIYHVQENKSR